MKRTLPNIPLSYSKTGVIQGYASFLILGPKHRFWVLHKAVLMCTHDLCFERKKKREFFFFVCLFYFIYFLLCGPRGRAVKSAVS